MSNRPVNPSFKDYGDLEVVQALTDRGWAQTYLVKDSSGELRIFKSGINKATHSALTKVSQIESPHFPKLLKQELEENSETFRVLLTFLEGRTIKELYAINGDWTMGEKVKRPNFRQAQQLTLAVLKTQDLLVSHGILYRDLQPGNIIIQPSGELGLIDFEQCELRENPQLGWLCESMMGTWETAPPEELAGPCVQLEHAAVYRVGALLLLLTTGAMPFKVSDRSLTGAKSGKEVALDRKKNLDFLEALPPRLAGVLRQLLHPDIPKRTATLAQAQKLIESLG